MARQTYLATKQTINEKLILKTLVLNLKSLGIEIQVHVRVAQISKWFRFGGLSKILPEKLLHA